MVDFDRPAFLLLIPAAILLPWLGARYSLALEEATGGSLCALRMVLLILLSLALAGPWWLTKAADAAVVLLRDVSASIGPDAEKGQFVEIMAAHPNRLQRLSSRVSLLSPRLSEPAPRGNRGLH